MHTMKMLFAAASLMALSAMDVGTSNAAPIHHEMGRHEMGRHETEGRAIARHEIVRRDFGRHDFGRPVVMRERVFDTLRFHRFRGLSDPYFLNGRYVVRSFDRFGRVVLVEVDPYTGAFIGVI